MIADADRADKMDILEERSHTDVLRTVAPCPDGASLMSGRGYGTCSTTLDRRYVFYWTGFLFEDGETEEDFLRRYRQQYPQAGESV